MGFARNLGGDLTLSTDMLSRRRGAFANYVPLMKTGHGKNG